MLFFEYYLGVGKCLYLLSFSHANLTLYIACTRKGRTDSFFR